MFNFLGFLFSFLKGIYNTCVIHTQVNKQASVARILFAGFFGIIWTSINETFFDAQINEYNKKLSTTPNEYDTPHDNIIATNTVPQLNNLHTNHPLSLFPRNYRNTAVTEHISTRHSYPQSPVTLLVAHQPNIKDTIKQIVEKPHVTNFALGTTIFLAHDEPPDWVPQPFPFLPIRATTLTGYKFTATISEKKINCSQVSNGNKTGLYHESYYPSNINKFLDLNTEDCKSELQHLKLTKYKCSNRKLVKFQVFFETLHIKQNLKDTKAI